MACGADIAIFGGAAGPGKSWALLAEALYHVSNPRFRCIVFRRTMPQIKQPGGLWDKSSELYPLMGARGSSQSSEWHFPSGAVVKLAGMELESDRFNFQGGEIPYIAFDELAQFTAAQFWYMLSRNRSMSGIPGYVRGATNPNSDSWLRHFLEWWIDERTGLAIPERDGKWRYFIRHHDTLQWADTNIELVEKFGASADPKSVTFIHADVWDNKILLEKDPKYVANLKALPYVDREQLLYGNWNVRAAAGNYFRREWFEIVKAAPAVVLGKCRYWDRAATEKKGDNDPDATVGVLVSKSEQNIYYVEDVRKMFATPLKVERAMLNCAIQDGRETRVGYMQDPGSAGVNEAESTSRSLTEYYVHYQTATGDKETRAKYASGQCECGNIKIVEGPWNDEFLQVLENFPIAPHDDEVDGLVGAVEELRAVSLGGLSKVEHDQERPDHAMSDDGGTLPRRGRGALF
jgi:predicted phage terminase large subunit-like protein